MKNVVAALNSSIQFHKKNFWIDPVSKNQYFVGVQYFEEDIDSVETLLDVPITSPSQEQPIPLRNIATLRRATVPTEITHTNLQATIDLTMGVYGRDLGPRRRRRGRVVDQFGSAQPDGVLDPLRPDGPAPANGSCIKGATIELSGEYSRMQETFRSLGFGLILASLLIYFLMAALFKSYLTPLVILFAVPARPDRRGPDALPDRHGDQRAVAAGRDLHGRHHGVQHRAADRLRPEPARRGGADARPRRSARRPRSACGRWSMTALAAFFALVPMALALGRGSEANAPLGRAVIGGILAGLVTTLFVVPSLYSLVVRDAGARIETAIEPT